MWKVLLYINSIRCMPRNRCLFLSFKHSHTCTHRSHKPNTHACVFPQTFTRTHKPADKHVNLITSRFLFSFTNYICMVVNLPAVSFVSGGVSRKTTDDCDFLQVYRTVYFLLHVILVSWVVIYPQLVKKSKHEQNGHLQGPVERDPL